MRHKKTRDIVIELTSLLDVVMILIFALMITNSQLVEARTVELAEAQKQNESMQDKLTELEGVSEDLANALAKLDKGKTEDLLKQIQIAESQLSAYEYMKDIVIVYNVGLENKYNNTERYLTYGDATDENGGKQVSARRKNSEEWEYAVNSLKLDLQEFLDNELSNDLEEKYIYIVFSVDESKVYENDYEDIKKALEMAENRYDNGRVRYRFQKVSEE